MPPAESPPSLLRKLTKNASFNSINHFWSLALGILLTPYILSHLGTEVYAIWTLINVLLGYANLVDLGLGTSFVKYIAQYQANKEDHNLNGLINTGLAFYGLLGICIGALVYIMGDWALRFLNIPPHLQSQAIQVLYLSVFAFMLNNLGSVFNAVQHGLQRLDISTKLKLALSVPQLGGTILALEYGYGLLGLVLNTTLWAIVHNLLAVIIAYRLLPKLKVSVQFVQMQYLREMLQYGSRLHASRLSAMVNFHFDKIVISKLAALNFVTFYDIGSKIVTNIRSVFLSLIQVIMPAVSELNAQGKQAEIKKLYLRTTKFLLLSSLPCFVLAIVAAPVLVATWVGNEFDQAILPMRLLAIGYFANLMGAPISFVVQGLGHPEIQMRTAILSLTLNICLSITLFFVFGFSGIMVGTSSAMLIAVLYYFNQFAKKLPSLNTFAMMSLTYKPLIATVIPSILVFVLNANVYETHFYDNRFLRFQLLCIDGLIFFAGYTSLIWALKFLTTEDVALLKRIVKRTN